jgi:hypothetical protein
MKKIFANATEALDGLLHDDMLIAAGGFGLRASMILASAFFCKRARSLK